MTTTEEKITELAYLQIANERIAALERAFRHFFKPQEAGKLHNERFCIKCGLHITDNVHIKPSDQPEQK